MHIHKNLFIVLDGLDGAGKGEMILRIHNYLFSKNKSISILTTREPTYGKHGKKIRELLSRDNNPKENSDIILELFVKDREEHLREIIVPFLEKKSGNLNVVLCDRYYYSTIAYQHAQGISLDKLISVNKKFLKPDIAFILDLPGNIAYQRIQTRERNKRKDMFETLEFLKKARENFLQLKDILDDNILIIDASKQKEAVFQEIKKELLSNHQF